MALRQLSRPVVAELGQTLARETNDLAFYQLVADLMYIGPESLPVLLSSKAAVNGGAMILSSSIQDLIAYDSHGAAEMLLKLSKDATPELRPHVTFYLGLSAQEIVADLSNQADLQPEALGRQLLENTIQTLIITARDINPLTRNAALSALESIRQALSQTNSNSALSSNVARDLKTSIDKILDVALPREEIAH